MAFQSKRGFFCKQTRLLLQANKASFAGKGSHFRTTNTSFYAQKAAKKAQENLCFAFLRGETAKAYNEFFITHIDYQPVTRSRPILPKIEERCAFTTALAFSAISIGNRACKYKTRNTLGPFTTSHIFTPFPTLLTSDCKRAEQGVNTKECTILI